MSTPDVLEGPAIDRVNILIVDDLQEKLLVYKTVLDGLQQNLVFVRSGAEALREVLAREFAVILLDVNMPDIDGFETAALVRRYKRSAHTPIIFITAFADEQQTSRGYALGAVDFIPSPVVPEMLRSKVRVFVELHVLQRRIARQADERVALAASAAALQMAEESTRRSAFLSELSRSLSGLLDVQAGMRTLLSQVVPSLAGEATLVLLDEQQQVQLVMRCCKALDGRGMAFQRADAMQAELSADERERLARALPHGNRPEALPAQFNAVHPLHHGERTLGALLIGGPSTTLGTAVLDDVALRAATAFATAQLYQNLQAEIGERRRAEARLEEASRRKDEFLAMLSHELRNPLAPIRNAVELIRRLAPNDAKLVWATDVTDRQVRQLTRLVDELLDVSRISQGKIVLQTLPLDLVALVVQCLDEQRPMITAHGQQLTQTLPEAPLWIQGDPARLQQVVSNLLSNANRYTPADGHLHLAVSVEDGHAVISVRDNGMGIDAELLPRVFDLFQQGRRALDRNQGGLGVGLTVVQRLVRLHDGHVEALSAGPGQGAEFKVRLPCLPLAPRPHAGEPAAAGGTPRRRVMVVEDNPDVAETTATMLTLFGHAVCVAHDGGQALAQVQAFAPEVVLLDIGLPLMDGYELARRLRQLPQTRDALLVALTGYGQPADRQRGREAGFDEHLLKPVDAAILGELVARAAPPAQEPVADSPAGAALYAFRRP
ncbi:response regulator [Aquabacterium sp.]|uniref:ATP-binding response regulator n=1 Tax=Aquabacterium sp. TaxID=1872578 RepID=UPI002CC5400C|nr:response regulator [Aquabacterium sp.]HSW04306.1 response regulator [Aquabacterium sp.]